MKPKKQEWIILNDPVTETADAAETALNVAARTADASGAGSIPERSKQSEGGTLTFHFESEDLGSVFNRDALLLMREIDTLVMSTPGYENFCQLEYDGVNATGCVERVSPVLYFFPSVDDATGEVKYDGNGELTEDLDAIVAMFSNDRRSFGYFLDGDFDANGGVNRVTRVKYPMGAPRPGYVAVDDREGAQRDEIGEGWLDAVEAKLFERFAMRASFLSTPYMGLLNEDGTDIRFYAGYLRSKDSQRIIGLDLSWAGASILAVWVYMSLHTGSVFIASLGMFEILASFPVSIFLYRVFFRVSYLGNIQILSVFVVLGVGADDVFVFFDAFKQSAYEPYEVSGTTLTRVLYTARRASKAIFVTSLTTAVAFAATAMSKVMPISAFGALSAIMIFVLFAVNVLFFPPALVLYDRWVRNAARRRANGEGKLAACLGGFGCVGPPGRDVAARADDADDVGSESSGDVAVVVGVDDASSSSSDGAGALSSDASLGSGRRGRRESRMDVAKLRPIEWFYREPFHACVAHPVIKFFVVASFAALLAVGVKMASELETPAEQEAWYPDTHLMQSFSNNRRRFMSSDEDRVVPVDLFWGLGGMDIEGVDKYDPRQRGVLELDATFDASSEAAQLFLVAACDFLKNATCDADGCGGPGSDLVRKKNGKDARVVCPMAAFRKYVEEVLVEPFPVTGLHTSSFAAKLQTFVASTHGSPYSSHLGFDESGALMFVRVSTESTLVFPTTAKTSRPVFDVWSAFVDDLNARAPRGVGNAKQTAYYTWTWMKTQEALVENTFQGLIICFCMAFVVLLLSTMDLRAGMIATVTIAGVVTTVMGVGVRGIMGWDLGIGESIAAVILIGLSVDYCVHLANAYCEAPASCDTRELRVQHALMTMGISITASAVTTIVSGSVLWLCILTFFSKFAFLITATIVSSFAWSLFFLPSALAAFGPPGRYSWSSLRPAQEWLVRKWQELRAK
jgi:protein dispatched 1